MYLKKNVNIEAMQRKFNTWIIGISEETKLNKKKEKILQIVISKKLLKWYFLKFETTSQKSTPLTLEYWPKMTTIKIF